MGLLVYDAGALLAADRRDRTVWGLHAAALLRVELPMTHAGVLGQVWRNGARQANLARLLKGCRVLPLDVSLGREAGELCGAASTADVTDAAIAIIAARTSGALLTSDPDDMAQLLDCLGARGRGVEVVTV